MTTLRRVQLIVRLEYGCHRHLLSGVAAHSRDARWDLIVSPYDQQALEFVVDPTCDGILTSHAAWTSARLTRRHWNKPLVFYGQRRDLPADMPDAVQWYPDEEGIAALAADHLIERGFTRYAYAHHHAWDQVSRGRGQAFRARLEAAGHECHWLDLGRRADVTERQASERAIQRLRALPRPLALFAFNDIVASQVLRAVHQAGLHCPGDVALLGVDNDELLCDCLSPPLSSVDTDWSRMGRAAAAQLDRWMNGETPTRREAPVPPLGVALRASTDFLAFADPLVVKALCFIRARVGEGIDTADVLAHVLVSRPTLDQRFRRHLGHTVADEIQSTRMERAHALLLKTPMTLEEVAVACGFKCADTLFRLFRQRYAMTPGQFRKERGAARPAAERAPA